jgi:hypothetical protein
MISEQLGPGPLKCVAALPVFRPNSAGATAMAGRLGYRGKRPLGWRSGNENRLYLTGKRNAVGPEGHQLDVTPKPGGKKLISFLRATIRSRLQLFGPTQQPQTAVLELKFAAVAKTVNGLSGR